MITNLGTCAHVRTHTHTHASARTCTRTHLEGGEEGLGLLLPVLELLGCGLARHLDGAALIHHLLKLLPVGR